MAIATSDERLVKVGGRELTVKHLDTVMFPQTGTTKAALIDYYARIAEFMLPHLSERAVTLKRYPHGVEDLTFFEKACPRNRPPWMSTVGRYAESRGRTTEYCVVNDIASLVWLVNQATIEFHVPLALRRSMNRPRTIVFDLDPGEGADVLACGEVALIVRERLRADGLESWIKTSGSKGLQLYVPINRRGVTFERTKAFAHAMAQELAAEHPHLIVANMRKSLRKGRVLIDWSQNDDNKTTVCVYSVRGRPHPTVSTPIEWRELQQALKKGDVDALTFEIDDVLKRVKRRGDVFAPVLEREQAVPRAS